MNAWVEPASVPLLIGLLAALPVTYALGLRVGRHFRSGTHRGATGTSGLGEPETGQHGRGGTTLYAVAGDRKNDRRPQCEPDTGQNAQPDGTQQAAATELLHLARELAKNHRAPRADASAPDG